jgi:hypothetical protein
VENDAAGSFVWQKFLADVLALSQFEISAGPDERL